MAVRLCCLVAASASSISCALEVGGRHRIVPELDPKEDKEFFGPPAEKADYPRDYRPRTLQHPKLSQPYPQMQSTDTYERDYVVDDNSDGGEWKAQMEYDDLRRKTDLAKNAVVAAKKKLVEKAQELEDAKKAHSEAEEKMKALEDKQKKADDMAKDAGAKEDAAGKAVEETEKNEEKEARDLEDCMKELEAAKAKVKQLEEEHEAQKKTVAEAEAAEEDLEAKAKELEAKAEEAAKAAKEARAAADAQKNTATTEAKKSDAVAGEAKASGEKADKAAMTLEECEAQLAAAKAKMEEMEKARGETSKQEEDAKTIVQIAEGDVKDFDKTHSVAEQAFAEAKAEHAQAKDNYEAALAHKEAIDKALKEAEKKLLGYRGGASHVAGASGGGAGHDYDSSDSSSADSAGGETGSSASATEPQPFRLIPGIRLPWEASAPRPAGCPNCPGGGGGGGGGAGGGGAGGEGGFGGGLESGASHLSSSLAALLLTAASISLSA